MFRLKIKILGTGNRLQAVLQWLYITIYLIVL